MNAVVAEEERKLSEHLGRASEHLRADKLQEAEAEIGAALALRGDDIRARNLRGLLLFRAGRYEEARAGYIDLAGQFPDDAAIRLNLGLVELRMGSNVEAAGCATPALASDSPGLRESVRQGETGFLVPHGDVRALADRMLQLAADPALVARLGRGARAFAEQLSWERAAGATEAQLYRIIAAGGVGGG